MSVINKGYSKLNGTSNYSKYYGSNKYNKVSTLKTLPTIGPSNSIGNTNLSTKTLNNKTSKKNYSTLSKEGPIYGPYSTLPKSSSNSNKTTASKTPAKTSSGGYGAGSVGVGGGSGGSSAASTATATTPAENRFLIDLSDILKSYTDAAEAQKQSILDTTASQQKMYEDSLKNAIEELKLNERTQRETLSKSLERFQEDTAKSRQQQQANFTSNRADLEAQAYLANRQALQSAAARGLGGSGLQQLAQLQNLINQSNATNELAGENTEALNALAQSLARQEQDTTSALNELADATTQKINTMSTENRNKIDALLSEQKNKINEIEKNSASTKAQLEYNENVRSQEANTAAERFEAEMRARAEELVASRSAQNASLAQSWRIHQEQLAANEKAEAKALEEYNNRVGTNLSNILKAAEDSMKIAGSSNKKTKKKLEGVETAYYNANAALRDFTSANNVDSGLISSYEQQLSSLLNTYNKKYNKK